MIMDTGMFIIRVVFGLAIASHGAQKLFSWFGGYGIRKTGGFFESLGFRPGAAFATAAGLSEFGGGLLITVGLLTPIGAVAVLSAMLVAMFSVHVKNGFFATGNGIELPFLYAVAAVGIAVTGGGAISLDGLLGLNSLKLIISL
jgi:putative oxidoreductase